MKSEKGQSFIELGISMVFLLVLLAGVMDLGRVIFTYIALRDAVQEGAAYAAYQPNNCGLAIKRIREHTSGAVDLSETNADITVTITYRTKTGTLIGQCNQIRNGAGVLFTLETVSPGSLNNVCPGDVVDVVARYNNFVIATPFIGAIVGGQTISFDTQVVDSIIVDPTPGAGSVCRP